MVEELTFGKKGSKFVIKQNIHLDDLLEGKPIERKYELVLYNTVAPLNRIVRVSSEGIVSTDEGVLESDSHSRIMDRDFYRIAPLYGWLTEIDDWRVLLGIADKKFLKKYKAKLKGIWLRYESTRIKRDFQKAGFQKGCQLLIDDMLNLLFGSYQYISRFISMEDANLREQAKDQIRGLVETEKKQLESETKSLSSMYKSAEIDREICDRKGQQLKESLHLLELFSNSFFSEDLKFFHLWNTYKIDSEYRKATRSVIGSIITRRDVMVRGINVKVGKKCRLSKKEIARQVIEALYGKGYFLEHALTVDLRRMVKEKREVIRFEKLRKDSYYFRDSRIPFYVLDKNSGIRVYGILDMDTESLSITEGQYFNTKEKVTHKI
ncbi:hypothetical protein KY342_06410 [Candidatus Woesearchaeota archaeon]|nr:hypothetical protein [Candidatus Woesearchaeota archaeon]